MNGRVYHPYVCGHCGIGHCDHCRGTYGGTPCACTHPQQQHPVDPVPVPAAATRQDDLFTLLEG